MEEGILPSGFCGLSELQTSGRETALIAFVETGIAAPTGMHGARNDINNPLDSGSRLRRVRNDGGVGWSSPSFLV